MLPRKILVKLREYPAFYRNAWLACASIPRGEVRTYGWIARRIGHPGAARAVGLAMKRNPFAPTVPCHRVVGASGALIGYSGPGGVRRKLALLKREGVRFKNYRPLKPV